MSASVDNATLGPVRCGPPISILGPEDHLHSEVWLGDVRKVDELIRIKGNPSKHPNFNIKLFLVPPNFIIYKVASRSRSFAKTVWIGDFFWLSQNLPLTSSWRYLKVLLAGSIRYLCIWTTYLSNFFWLIWVTIEGQTPQGRKVPWKWCSNPTWARKIRIWIFGRKNKF